MKLLVMVMTVLAFIDGACADSAAVREALEIVTTNVNRKTLRIFTLGEIGGQHVCTNASYQSLSQIVSNDWQNIIGSLGTITTNQTERRLILGTGFQYGWDFHVPFLSRVADECIAGNISTNDVTWLEGYSTKPGLIDQFYYRHSEPAVSNLVLKLMSIDGMTNHWMEVLSEDATQRVQEYISAGILYIPE